MKIKAETLEQKQAFECYYAMGVKRTYAAVALQFKVSSIMIARWAHTFEWDERIAMRDAIIASKLEEYEIRSIVEAKRHYRKIIQKAIDAAYSNKKLKLKIESIADLEKLIKLDLLLMGEPTEITEPKQPLAAQLKEIYSHDQLIRFRELLVAGIERKKEIDNANGGSGEQLRGKL